MKDVFVRKRKKRSNSPGETGSTVGRRERNESIPSEQILEARRIART
jgi:hypothetical protein